ncbi:MAG TPA: outer membrane beta-barrel protein [Pricia sp.]|nr:outer membrane beta-barrel protein [Pricia sp.]
MDKKNLDELFREKFKAFRQVPDERVWAAIERSLDKKRQSHVVPLWWKLGGVAAVLAIGLIVFYPLVDNTGEAPAVTDTENRVDKGAENDDAGEKEGMDAVKKKTGDEVFPVIESQKDALVNDSEEAFPISDSTRDAGVDDGPGDGSYKNDGPKNNIDGSVASQADTRTNSGQEPGKVVQNGMEPAGHKNENRVQGGKNPNGQNAEIAAPKGIAAQNSDTPRNTEKTRNSEIPRIEVKVQNEDKPRNSEIARIQDTSNDPKKPTDTGEEDTEKKSLFEAMEEQAEEAKIAEEDSDGRWSAGPSIAPVYFNAMGEGSPIDPGFATNSKSGSTNLSYGLSVAYAINDRLSVRSGIHKADYGYDTNEVGFSPTLAASSGGRLQNIDYAEGPANLAVNDAVSGSEYANNQDSEFRTLNSARDGTVAQRFGYLEVPLELDYALVDRRFGVNLVGGISSLLLIHNAVTLNSGNLTAEIGEASNLNGLNFSTNIGFGVNYEFTPRIQINVEPVFKYQLNTFSNTSGDFRPYTIGVYSGLNFRF